MDLQEIRYFLTLSKTLNFTKAAEICGIGQPALTRAIRRMEEELGGLLFSRERNNTHVTELGRLIEAVEKVCTGDGRPELLVMRTARKASHAKLPQMVKVSGGGKWLST